MVAKLTSAIAALALFTCAVSASNEIVQIVDANNFCVMLPPTDSADRLISDTEWDGRSFCMGSTPKATGAGKLPSGFITSAHYVKEDAYVQVTGQIDYTKANLNGSDYGGQYDVKAPVGSTCAGWSYYVNLIEPTEGTYCIRCCNDTVTCNRGISEKGCAHIIPGDYSGPGASSGGSTGSSGSAAASTPAAAASTTPAAASSSAASSAASSKSSSSASASQNNVAASATSSPASVSGIASEQSVSAASSNMPIALVAGAAILTSIGILA